MDDPVAGATARTPALQLLGPVRAHHGSTPLPLGGVKARGVLAMLALRAPQAAATHKLSHGLWGDSAPPSAASTLQAYVSRLRSALGADVVVSGREGYRLALHPQQIDVHRFDAMLRQGRSCAEQEPRHAVELVEQAVAQWQSQALADLRELPFALAAAARLDADRIAGLELLFELRLRLGQQEEVLSRLRVLVEDHPLNERLTAQLMLALYRTGHQVEAPEVYGRLRTALVQELGVDPGTETRTLHSAVLRQDTSLHADGPPVPAAGNLPRPGTSFEGREPELAELARHLERTRLLALVGPSGIGKSRLALELGRTRRPRDGSWLVDLRAVVDADAVVALVNAALDVREQPGVAPEEALLDALRHREALLVADGCDHVRAACADLFGPLVESCPGLRVVTTSVASMPAGEGRAFVTAALRATPDDRSPARSRTHLAGATLGYLAGDLAALDLHVRAGLDGASGQSDPGLLGQLLALAAWHCLLSGDPAQARERAHESLARAREADSPGVEAEALLTLGMVERISGASAAAAEVLEQARVVGSAVGHEWAVGSATWIAAKVAHDRGRLVESHRLYTESLRRLVAADDLAGALVILHGIAGLAAAGGHPDRGAQLLGAICAHGQRIGDDPVRMDPLDGPRYEQVVRAALTGDAFGVAFERGRRASFPEAAALGYAGLNPAEDVDPPVVERQHT